MTTQDLTLNDFDLDQASLATIISEAHAARQAMSPLAPRNARGMTFYFLLVASLRAHLLRTPGWVRRTVAGLEFVENEEKGIRLGYLAGDDGTGHPERELKSARTRGVASEVAAASNFQTCIDFPVEYFVKTKQDGERDLQEWFLVVRQHSATQYMVEIALPIEVKGGHFTDWAKRLNVGEVPLDVEPKLPSNDTATVEKPTLKRKKNKKKNGEPDGETGASETG